MRTMKDMVIAANPDLMLGEVLEDLYMSGLKDALIVEPPAEGGPCYVVDMATWKAAVDEMCRRAMPFQGAPPSLFDEMREEEKDSHRCVAEAQLEVALAALLGPGKLRVAKAVGKFVPAYPALDTTTTLGPTVCDMKADGGWIDTMLYDGMSVAVLEDEA